MEQSELFGGMENAAAEHSEGREAEEPNVFELL